MISVVYELVTSLLLLTAVRSTSVQPKQIIYVDEVNGTLDPYCWENRDELPCSGMNMALDGMKLHNSTLVVLKPNCKCKEFQESIDYVPDHQQCPTWLFPDPSSNATCICGDDIDGAVRCSNSTKEAAILSCYCMTYNESTGPVVGICFYNCVHNVLKDDLYHLLPSNVVELNNMCGYFNREGQLCGKCKENYSIPVYSYDLNCVKCPNSPFNWVKYILAAFLPLTVFFVLVVSCRFSATSPKLFAFVFFSQTCAEGANVRIVLAELKPHPIVESLAKVLFAIYGIWNLDFFRTLIPHICVNVDTLKALALDYAVAVYPLILLVRSNICTHSISHLQFQNH